MTILAHLHTAVGEETSVLGSARALVQGIAHHIHRANSSGDPAALGNLITALNYEGDALANAVVANTPAADELAPPVKASAPGDEFPAPEPELGRA
jgi:hypothetical protein